jgi:hypothetical protein
MFDFFPADEGGGGRGPSGTAEWPAEGRGAEVTWSGVAVGLRLETVVLKLWKLRGSPESAALLML